MHYWVWHGKDSFEDFDKNVGRFMVEYGFQSFPNYGSLKDMRRYQLVFELANNEKKAKKLCWQ